MQQFGALFKWDVLEEDTLAFYRQPWDVLAARHNLEPPRDDEVLRAVGMRMERAIAMFRWTDDWGFTRQLAFEHYEARMETLGAHEFSPPEGTTEWLDILKNYRVP